MSETLNGRHYCIEHQGNTSHYAEKNCLVCSLQSENAQLKSQLKEIEEVNKEYYKVITTLAKKETKWEMEIKQVEQLKSKLEQARGCVNWYEEQIAALKRYMSVKPPVTNGIEAVMIALSLDGGQRARDFLEEKDDI